MCAYMGNTVYAIRCVYLWIMVGGGHTAFGQFRSKSNKRPWRVPTHLMKREKKIINKPAANGVSTLLRGAFIKKRRYKDV